MQVIFRDNDVLRAAVLVANESYFPILQLERRGDRLRIIGSNGYVLVSGDVEADFAGWEDGRGVLMRDSYPMEELKRVLKCSDHVAKRVEVEGGCASVHVDDEQIGTYLLFVNAGQRLVQTSELFEVVGQEPGGACVLSGSSLELAAKAANVVSRSCYGWVVEQHGPKKPVVMKYDGGTGNDQNIFILAMPMRPDGKVA